MVLEECPFCHKFLAAELLSRDDVDTGEFLKEKDAILRAGLTIESAERVADHPESFIAYRFAYRCKNCEKEWIGFKVREVEVPRESIEDEEQKIDYGVDKGSEDAREEEYYATEEE